MVKFCSALLLANYVLMWQPIQARRQNIVPNLSKCCGFPILSTCFKLIIISTCNSTEKRNDEIDCKNLIFHTILFWFWKMWSKPEHDYLSYIFYLTVIIFVYSVFINKFIIYSPWNATHCLLLRVSFGLLYRHWVVSIS